MGVPLGVPRGTVVLDRPRAVTLQLDALLRLTEALGVPLHELEASPPQMAPVLDAWVWACLTDDDRADVTREEIRAMLHLGNMGDCIQEIIRVASLSMPEGAEGNGGPPKGRKAKA